MTNVQISKIKIKSTIDDDFQTGNLEVILHANAEETVFLCAQLLDRNGAEVDRIFPIAVEREMDFCMQVTAVNLWNAESVYLYDLVMELRDEKMQLLGSTVKKIAFRRWDTGYILNGKEPYLREKKLDNPNSYSEEQRRQKLSDLKKTHPINISPLSPSHATHSVAAGGETYRHTLSALRAEDMRSTRRPGYAMPHTFL